MSQSSGLERALATEIRIEMTRQRMTARTMQDATGVSASAWGNYFVRCTRHIPVSVVFGVASVLEVSVSELIARAEATLSGGHNPFLDLMSPEARRAIESSRPTETNP